MTDPTRPVPIGVAPDDAYYSAQFVNGSEISYGNNTSILRVAIGGNHTVVVANFCYGLFGMAWSPDGSQLAYLTDSADGSQVQLHIVSGGIDRVVDESMARMPWGVGCEGLPCADDTNSDLRYSPDGSYISMVQDWSTSVLRVWSSAGKLITKIDAANSNDRADAVWSVWSGRTLYYRDPKGVEAWRDGSISLLLPGVRWISPSSSSGGGRIVYTTRDTSGVPHVFLLDTGTNQVRELAKLRAYPVFLTPQYIVYEAQNACTEATWPGCLGSQHYLFALTLGTESKTSIGGALDVWPHAA